MFQGNPFIIEGYVAPKYFCDRTAETKQLVSDIANGRNVALIAKRRMGKSGLIHNMFYQEEIKKHYYTFYVDIYETKNMSEFVFELGKSILSVLKSQERKIWEAFLEILVSLNHSITFNSQGLPVWSVKIGEIRHPDVTLDEIFSYLSSADRPCIVAIDEFQVITDYPEKTVEAALRKRIQNCHNACFIYSGSQRHMMAQIFASPSRPFYNSCAIMGLQPIQRDAYLEFANSHLASNVKNIDSEAFEYLYNRFDGITWYIQYVLNVLYSTETNSISFGKNDVDVAIEEIVRRNSFAYSSLLFLLTTKQKQVLYAIANENKVTALMSQSFLQTYNLSSSTVQTAISSLMDRDFVTRDDDGAYMVYDRFLDIWLKEK